MLGLPVIDMARMEHSGSLVFVPVFLEQSPAGSLIVSSRRQNPRGVYNGIFLLVRHQAASSCVL